MILHIVTDEKFTVDGLSRFEEAAPGENKAVTILPPDRKLRFLVGNSIERFSRKELLSPRFLRLLNHADAVVFHSLDFEALVVLRLVIMLHFHGKIVWLGWGFDYQDLLGPTSDMLYEPKTLALLDRFELLPPPSKKRTWLGLAALSKTKVFNKKSLIRRVDLFAPVLETEFQQVKRATPGFRANQIRWNYGMVTSYYENVRCEPPRIPKNILLGNSATPTNNHMDSLEILASVGGLDGRKVITPLSYGDPKYRDAIIDAGQSSLGSSFFPVVQYMPLPDYLSLISTCTHVVMNHRRQQGGGNILAALYQGACVFLNERSSFYEFMISKGFHVFRAGDIFHKPELLNELLSSKQVGENRRLLDENFGSERLRINTREILERILS